MSAAKTQASATGKPGRRSRGGVPAMGGGPTTGGIPSGGTGGAYDAEPGRGTTGTLGTPLVGGSPALSGDPDAASFVSAAAPNTPAPKAIETTAAPNQITMLQGAILRSSQVAKRMVKAEIPLAPGFETWSEEDKAAFILSEAVNRIEKSMDVLHFA